MTPEQRGSATATTHLVARGAADVVATSQPLAPEVRDEIFALLHATRRTRHIDNRAAS